MMTDPISDFLTRIRNAQLVKHSSVSAPASKMKTRIAELLKKEGYIADIDYEPAKHGQKIVLTLKYDEHNAPVIEGLKRISKPGLRIYRGADNLPEVRGGLGMAVVSTSTGVMTGQSARDANVGGEVLCYVW